MASSCELGNEISGSIKGLAFLDRLNEYHFHKKNSAPFMCFILNPKLINTRYLSPLLSNICLKYVFGN
jgi:hypothetical protein